MPPPSWAAVVTAFATLFVAIAGLVGALTLFLPVLRLSRTNAKKLGDVEMKVDGVHVIVNQQRTDQLNYQRALIRALQDQGIAVPIDQSIQSLKEEPG
jgi:hypothetical protein